MVALVVGLAMGVGLVFAAIVGGSAALAYVVWLGTTYRRPVDPDEVRSLYPLVIAGELVHQVEEYVADFPRHLSAGFHLTGFTQDRFVVMILLFAAVGLVPAGGLEYRHPGANYVMWFVVVGPGFVNGVAHVLFPVVLGQPYFPGPSPSGSRSSPGSCSSAASSSTADPPPVASGRSDRVGVRDDLSTGGTALPGSFPPCTSPEPVAGAPTDPARRTGSVTPPRRDTSVGGTDLPDRRYPRRRMNQRSSTRPPSVEPMCDPSEAVGG